MTNPLAIAAKGKGYTALFKRVRTIWQRYGLTSTKMNGALQLFAGILQRYNCGATFPITTAALARNGPVIAKYQAQNIEFAMHGLFHIDHSQLALEQQTEQIKQARQIFQHENVNLTGFRCPYLRWNEATLAAVNENGLAYDSSQALYWEVAQQYETEDYRRVLNFYGAKSAQMYPALPKIRGTLVQIPYCVPDDEALIERFRLSDIQAMSQIWQAILEQTHHLGELFTLGLHPERIGLLHQPLAHTLAQARQLSPHVWIARLDEITRWWLAHRQTNFELTVEGDNLFRLTIKGPAGLTVFGRYVSSDASTKPWADSIERILATDFRFQANQRPCIGVSPMSAPVLVEFLQQQGYWVEISDQPQHYSIYFDQSKFTPEDERPLLAQLAQSDAPLIWVGRWPDAAQSAMCVTGDIDALTIWDYGLRFIGR
jgi:peptidoglycan/xylan/chitin deacetylase (PgdA/CDA1 family)